MYICCRGRYLRVQLGSYQETHSQGVYKDVHKLETINILNVPNNAVSKVASTVAAAKKMGIQVRWIDNAIEEIHARRDRLREV